MRLAADLLRDIVVGLAMAITVAVVLAATVTGLVYFLRCPDCVERVNREPELCNRLGGVLDSEADGTTVCVFIGVEPP